MGSFGAGRLVYSMLDPGYHQEFGANIPAAQLLIQNAISWSSASVTTFIQDDIRGDPAVSASAGNMMDQNQNAITNETNVDAFAVPTPTNGIPFQLPYSQDTLPLIIPGPHVVTTYTVTAAAVDVADISSAYNVGDILTVVGGTSTQVALLEVT